MLEQNHMLKFREHHLRPWLGLGWRHLAGGSKLDCMVAIFLRVLFVIVRGHVVISHFLLGLLVIHLTLE
jgi:hypothetical protein